MTITDDMHNRHPVDRLADVRSEINRPEVKEAGLHKMLLADDADLEGSEYAGEEFSRMIDDPSWVYSRA